MRHFIVVCLAFLAGCGLPKEVTTTKKVVYVDSLVTVKVPKDSTVLTVSYDTIHKLFTDTTRVFVKQSVKGQARIIIRGSSGNVLSVKAICNEDSLKVVLKLKNEELTKVIDLSRESKLKLDQYRKDTWKYGLFCVLLIGISLYLAGKVYFEKLYKKEEA